MVLQLRPLNHMALYADIIHTARWFRMVCDLEHYWFLSSLDVSA